MTDSHWLADLETLIGRNLISNDNAPEHIALGSQELLASVPDDKILQAYLATGGQLGDPLGDLLLAVIKQRGIGL